MTFTASVLFAVAPGELGVSVVQLTAQLTGEVVVRARLFAGAEAAPLEYTGDYNVPIAAYGETVRVRALSPAGYNPRTATVVPVGTPQCKVAAGSCDVAPCSGSDDYLAGSCTMETESLCKPRTVCGPDESAPIVRPGPSEDRNCTAYTADPEVPLTLSSAASLFLDRAAYAIGGVEASVPIWTPQGPDAASFTAVAGDDAATATASAPLPPLEAAAALGAAIVTPRVWRDARAVTFAAQLRTAAFDTRVDSAVSK